MRRLLLALALTSACSDGDVPAPRESACAEASARSGELECLHAATSVDAWRSVSVALEPIDQARGTKYLMPARDGARLPPLLLNGARHELHFDFLVAAFPKLFAGLTPKDYLALLFDESKREFLAGSVIEYRRVDEPARFGFTVAGDPKQPDFIGCDDVRAVRDALAARLPPAELFVVPSDRDQLERFAECNVPLVEPGAVAYEAYHRAAAFGTVRRFRAQELGPAIERAEVGFQDMLVLEEAPSDIETVVSGVVTGSRQGPLSHVAVRSASRGTPNCYLKDAYDYLAAFEGKLVRLECAARELLVREATPAEASQYWDELRPEPVEIALPDRDFTELVDLEALSLSTAEERALASARFGAKGKNLAWLRQNLDPALTPRGFLIPIAHYLRFIADNEWQVDLGDGVRAHSFAQTLEAWAADATFTADAAERRRRLTALQTAMRSATCDPALVEAVGERLVITFGDAAVTARFRSSSNAEDGAFFNGAGLYDSYSGCWADDLDDDVVGPSVCDPDETDERGVCRALRKVWASLHNPKAFDERAFYGIEAARVGMGVLVNERSEAELANMVVFSGNPSARSDDRYLVNAQVGELPVVSPEPGMWPEQVLLTLEQGEVSQIERASASSELEPGQTVLTDEQLETLGRELARLAAIYPHDAEPPRGHDFLLDSEWKLMPDASLRIKQVRPFLR